VENLGVEFRKGSVGAVMKPGAGLTEDGFNRLAKALMEKHLIGYDEALKRMHTLRLHIICDSAASHQACYQAALLTAVNAGNRTFLGGVRVTMPDNLYCNLPWAHAGSLNTIVGTLGAKLSPDCLASTDVTLVLGENQSSDPDAIRVLCDGWRGGTQPADHKVSFIGGEDFALGGILAGGLAVENAFLRACSLDQGACDRPAGCSIWRPDIDWIDLEALGPPLQYLPKRLWVIGLGHLGQAYVWSLGLLPYRDPSEVTILLQDFDRVIDANWVSGLLCQQQDVEIYKTRLAARWLESRQFKTVITERRFDVGTVRSDEEPFVALCGVDVVAARRILDRAGFDLVVECGLGSHVDDFDRLMIHTFPGAAKLPEEVWPKTQNTADIQKPIPMIAEALKGHEDCGILARTLASKAISSSFVGAAAGAMVVGELLRALHGGFRCELLHAHLRSLRNRRIVFHADRYRSEMARAGFVPSAALNTGHIAGKKTA
jgi:hypothetical protein